MTHFERFEELEAWQTARELTRGVYGVSNTGPFARDFALKDQIRRASISVMSNIAEGFESRTTRLFIDLLGRARASAGEVRSQLYVAVDQGYIDEESFDRLTALATSVSRQIRKFSQYLGSAGERFTTREPESPYRADPE